MKSFPPCLCPLLLRPVLGAVITEAKKALQAVRGPLNSMAYVENHLH